MFISGNNFQDGAMRGNASYYFSAYPHIWGWATWRKTWNEYDFLLEKISAKEFKTILKKYFSLWTEQQFWLDKFLLMKKQAINTWDFQLTFCIWKNKGIAILPKVNLVSNIGFGADAIHCTDTEHKFANIPTKDIYPLQHPTIIERNRVADEYFYKTYNYKSPLKILYRIILRVKHQFIQKHSL